MLLAKILLIFACVFCSLAMPTNQAAAEELWYTVQAGSYTNQKDAKSFYDVLAKKLHPATVSDLRIEYVSSYYTVRAGKFKASKDITPLFEEIQTFANQPLLIYAYVRPTRIVWPPEQLKSSKRNRNRNPTPISPVASKITNQEIPLPQEPLFYTIQAGSYLTQDDATQLYENLAQKLPPKMRTFLRIEKISSFLTVRFGKKIDRQAVTRLLQEAKKFVGDPIIIHAYIRESRILQSFSSAQQLKKELPVSRNITQSIQKQKNIIQPKSKHEQTNPKVTVTEQMLPPPALPLPLPLPLPKNTEIIRATETVQPSLSPEEYEKKLLAKYLETSHQTKDRAAARKKAASFAPSTNCTTSSCHTLLQEIPLAHYPAKEAKCLACHKQLTKQHPSEGSPDFQLVANGATLCQQCHLSIIQGEVIHTPAKEGNCLKCHAPHGSGNPFLLPVPMDQEQDLCMECHDKGISDHKYQHGPVGLGKCTFCHNPHATDHGSLLREEPKKLCINCHNEFEKGLRDSANVHAPVKNRDCQYCHAVHGSSFPNLLTADPHDFCFTCHPDVQDKFDKSRTKHAGLYLEKQCGTCHLAHYSPYKYLLIKKEKELCLSCHGNNSSFKAYSPKNIEKEINNKEYIHAPVSQGKCASCHAPHGSSFDSLLLDKYPSSFYAPYDPERYDLCFTCHTRELLTSEMTTDATKFRNGSNNLHFAHVAIARKGRTCNACHNAHASDGPKLINRTGAKFGEWTMSIDFNLTNTGGSCMPGCHRKMNYDREVPAVNDAKNTTTEKYYIDYKSKN